LKVFLDHGGPDDARKESGASTLLKFVAVYVHARVNVYVSNDSAGQPFLMFVYLEKKRSNPGHVFINAYKAFHHKI
jgi:hypothetical protein